MYVPKTKEQLRVKFTEILSSLGLDPLRNGITQSILEGAIDILHESEMKKQRLDNETNPTLAEGDLLTAIAASIGVFRRENSGIVSDLTFTNFHFYLTESATAGSITVDGEGFILPGGLTITDALGNSFVTILPVTFRPDTNIAFTQIVANGSVRENILPATLISHSFDLFVIPNITEESLGNITLECSNAKEIVTQGPPEDDDEVRFRMSIRPNAFNQSNDEKIREVLLAIPGIDDITLSKNKRGVGSVEVILHTSTNLPSDALYAKAEAEINDGVYGADNIYIMKPQYLPVRINFKPEYAEEGELTNLAQVRTLIALAATDYVNNNIPQGGLFDPTACVSYIMEKIEGISNLVLECLYINNRRVIPGPQQLLANQRFIVMNPIDITVG